MLPCSLAGSNRPHVQPGGRGGPAQPGAARPGDVQVQMIDLKGSKSGEEGEMKIKGQVKS